MKKGFLALLGTVGLMASLLGSTACVVTGTGNTGGSGGAAGAGVGGSGEGGAAGGGTGGQGGQGGAAACDMTLGCADAITSNPKNAKPCGNENSGTLFDAYLACVCTDKCKAECGADAICTTQYDGTPMAAGCDMCRQTNCKAEAEACGNDVK